MTPKKKTAAAGADVELVQAEGRSMPVDAEPSAGGTLSLEHRHHRAPLATTVAKAEAANRTDLRRSHFATCPEATTWRKGRH